MQDNSSQETIDNRYEIIEQKGHGATANVYTVKELNNQTIYAAKVLKKHSNLFDKEVNILNALRTENCPNMV